jgi:hypothetical protein
MDTLVTFAAGGKPSHAMPPDWFVMVGIAAGIAYWTFLKIRYSMRKKRERREAEQEPPPVSPRDSERHRAETGSTCDPRSQNAVALANLDQCLAYIIVLAGLGIWTIIEPPPERWMPLVALLLAAMAVLVEGVLLWKQRQRR